MRVLCVAEKPSISKSISQILSGGQFTTTATGSQYIKNYSFDYPQTNSSFVVTCVSGHLTESDFTEQHRKWQSCDPFELFDAPVDTFVPKDKKAIETNLKNQARNADMLMIWTDCDREGEHIGLEIVNVCKKANRTIRVKRARFSAIIAQQIHRAAQQPVELDRAQADSVEARRMIDLKIGAAFTRMQTFALQNRFGQLSEGNKLVSYGWFPLIVFRPFVYMAEGPCQFPTLGFVVQKYNLVNSFVSEPFWYIYLALTRDGGEETVFTWKRGHLFDRPATVSLYDLLLEDPLAHVIKVTKKETKKWKPLPLTTVELQKSGSRLLRLAPKKVLDIAEKLYQQGFVSYPRTETDQFDPQFDLMSLVQKQTVDPNWGTFATALTQGAGCPPRNGKNNDKAHPPIHPTAHAGNLVGDDKRVYEYITRRFLACCSTDAKGWQTTVDVECGGEFFSATGLVILERNYLEVYPYDKWVGHNIPDFEQDEVFQPSVCELREGKTSKPNLLTEADLVTLMDKNGIGTDATIAQHIETIINREYVIPRMEGSTKYLVPSTLGIGLVEGYNQIGLHKSLSKPQLRRETERNMVQVCEGRKSKSDMLEEAIMQYKDMYIITKREFDKVVSSVRRYIEGGNGQQARRNNGGGNDDEDDDDDDDDYGNGYGGRGGRGGGRGGRGNGNDGAPAPMRGRGAPASRGRGGRRDAPIDIPDSDDDLDLLPPPPPAAARRNAQAGVNVSRPTVPSVPSSPKPPSAQPTTGVNPRTTLPQPPPRQAAPPRGYPTNTILCDCGIPATHRQRTDEFGIEYWECGNNKACNFYRDTNRTVIPAKRPHSEHRGESSGAARMCKCNKPAIQLSANTAANAGRKFWKCANSQQEGDCKYFAWDDEPERPSETQRTSSSAVGTQGRDECFKNAPTKDQTTNDGRVLEPRLVEEHPQ
ncbi:hypothetical protein H0H92_001209 [Tricholoma furcatifolium]|nr:hypothetical protein H0H92_001209 [Tricholoma furcatifolium]